MSGPVIINPTLARQSEPDLASLARLRRKISAIERRGVSVENTPALAFGVPEIDAALGGGLAQGALHEIAAVREAELVAATGFAVALASHPAGAVLWVAEDMGFRESGSLFGAGLDEAGLPPERFVLARAAQPRDLLWAMEEGLRCRSVTVVVGEMRAARHLDEVATRRLSLAAANGGAMALLVLGQPSPRASPAMTRWIVSSAPSSPASYGVGPPCIRAELIRNRYGRLGTWMLELSSVDRRFHLAAAHSQPLAETIVDGQDRAAIA